MKLPSFLIMAGAGVFLGIFVLIQCSQDNPAAPARSITDLDREIAGVWRFSLAYNADTTFNIVMTYDSSFVYKINVNINSTDTMERENGTWFIVSDTVAKADTVWMVRGHCHQINLTTHTLDSIDCGVDTGGIKLRISPSGSTAVWVIPLNDFASYLPPNLVPPGSSLPIGNFYKD
jgi:hypothetical protein